MGKVDDSEKELLDNEELFGGSENEENGQLLEILLNTREQGQMVESLIHNQIEVKDNLIDKLHKELEHYKQNEADRYVEQVMKAVIKVRKDVMRVMTSDAWPDMSKEEIKREYGYVFEDLTDLLEQQNIDAYSTAPGEPFNAAIHQPKAEHTDDPALDKKVKLSLSEGYKKGEKVLLPERVVVYKL